jgi:hypothetical protein
MTKKRKRPVPIALLWTRRDQLRFSDTVEKLVRVVNDLVVVVEELKRERVHTPQPRRRKAAAAAAADRGSAGLPAAAAADGP